MSRDANVDVFISHSSKDREIAAALIELLRAALNIPAAKLRCTSVDGYRLPAGASTDEQLRQEIYDAKVFLGLVTPASSQSTYVLFELGARWGAKLHLTPVLASGTDASTLRAPLSSLNALSCDEPAQLHQLVDNIASILKIAPGSPSSYQKYIDALVKLSTRGGEEYRAAVRGEAINPSAPSAQTDEHDTRLFTRFLSALPSRSKGVRFLREHDSGVSFPSEWLDSLYDFINRWNNAEHEFNNPTLEKKRLEFWNALNHFLRELGGYTSSTGRAGWLSIDMKDWEDRPEMLEAHERLNELGTVAYEAHQNLVRTGRRIGISVRTE